MASTAQAALTAALTRWNAGDLDGYLEIYDDRIQLHLGSEPPLDKDGVRAFYESIWAAFGSAPPLTVEEMLWDGDTATVRFTMGGTHVGEFNGIAPTGRTITLPGITTLRFEGDKIVERHSQADMLGLLVQLGAIPAPA